MRLLNKKALWIAIVAIMIILIALNLFQYQKNIELSEGFPHTISEIKASRETFLGKKVTVEGYLVKTGGEYFLIQSFDLFLVNTPMPEDQYLPMRGLDINKTRDLVGGLIRVKGTIIEDKDQLTLDFDPTTDPFEIDLSKVKFYAYIMEYFEIEIRPFSIFSANYAVLISGGANQANAHSRYWNDLKLVYSILVNNYSYNPDRIIVIYKNGVGEDNDMPVDFSATTTNVATAFQNVAGNITNQQTLFVFTTNHGGGFHPNDPFGNYNYGINDANGDEPEAGYSEAVFGTDFNNDGDLLDMQPAVDEVLNLYYNQLLLDDDLATMLNNINSNRTIVVMEQCFSGGFISDLSGPNRVILTACHEEEFSWAADTEGNFDEFAFHFAEAINTSDMRADSDSDGEISMQEAFNFASQNDSGNEQPQYDDDGDGVGHQQPIPNGGDGPFGDTTYLDT